MMESTAPHTTQADGSPGFRTLGPCVICDRQGTFHLTFLGCLCERCRAKIVESKDFVVVYLKGIVNG
jgi:hypothetical protein